MESADEEAEGKIAAPASRPLNPFGAESSCDGLKVRCLGFWAASFEMYPCCADLLGWQIRANANTMRFFSTWRRNRAAKAYARMLGPWLAQNFGSGGTYTPQQIARAVKALKLDPRYIVLAYGRFLKEEDFDVLHDSLPVQMTFDEARGLMDRFASLGVKFDSEPDSSYRPHQGVPPGYP